MFIEIKKIIDILKVLLVINFTKIFEHTSYISLINLAGFPNTREFGLTSFVTTDPIPIIELLPMVI